MVFGAKIVDDKSAINSIKVKKLHNSIKFYLPRVEGYLEVIRNISSQYIGMSLIEFDGYFGGKFEPMKYLPAEVHTDDIDKDALILQANRIQKQLKQLTSALELNNELILISEDK